MLSVCNNERLHVNCSHRLPYCIINSIALLKRKEAKTNLRCAMNGYHWQIKLIMMFRRSLPCIKIGCTLVKNKCKEKNHVLLKLILLGKYDPSLELISKRAVILQSIGTDIFRPEILQNFQHTYDDSKWWWTTLRNGR